MADKRFVAKNGLDNNNQTITNVAPPVNSTDVSTKAFSSDASNLTTGTIPADRVPSTLILDKTLTGYAVGANTVLAATDTFVQAFGKLQGQMNARLTGNETITVSGDATGSGATAITLTLANSGAAAGSYGSSTAVPVITIDAKGRVTSVTTASISGSLTFTGDVTGSGTTGSSTALTLSSTGVVAGTYKSVTVDAKGRVTAGTNPTTLSGYGITDAQPLDADLTAIAALAGTSGLLKKTAADTWTLDTSAYLTGNQSISLSGDASGSGTTAITVTLANTGVAAGTYTKVTVDAKGRVTSATTLSSGDLPTYTGTLTSGQVTTALGFTPENAANKGQASGYASLDSGGKVPAAQLPSYVDDVLEYANLAAFPGTGETGKIYVTLDTNKVYRWTGSTYVEISQSPGTTDSLLEGSTNLYFTNTRARNSISVSGSLSYNATTGQISYTQPTNVSTFTNDSGYLTGITSGQVTTALGYTPQYHRTDLSNLSSSADLSQPLSTFDYNTPTGGPGGWVNGWISTHSNYLHSLITNEHRTANWWVGYMEEGATSPVWHKLLHSTNYNSYSPTLTGGGASGTWGINITGNAATATAATDSTKLPLAGGTMSGQLAFSGSTGYAPIAILGGAAGYYPAVQDGAGRVNWYWNKAGSGVSPTYEVAGEDAVRLKFSTSQAAGAEAGMGVYYAAAGAAGAAITWTEILGAFHNGFRYLGNVVLHASNYNSYSPTLTGTGASGTWGIDVTGTAAGITGYALAADTAPATSIMTRNGSGDGSIASRFHFRTAEGDGGTFAIIGLNWGGAVGTYKNFEIYDYVNGRQVIRVFGETRNVEIYGGLTIGGNAALHAGNYNSYSPTLTGGGASGTWGINITGSANSATTASAAGYADYTTFGFNTDLNLNNVNIGNRFGAYNVYYGAGGSYNQPIPGVHHFRIIQFGGYSGGNESNIWRGQIAQNFYDDRMWFRKEYSTTWGEWREFLHSGNYSSYALPLSGGLLSGQLILNQNIATPSNYYNGLQLEVRATSGTAGIGLHRSGYSHVGIYHDESDVLKFNMNGGTVVMNATIGTLIGSGNYTSYAVARAGANRPGGYRLQRRDNDSDYSVQTYWTGSYWRLYGYSGDTAHADTQVGLADSASYATNAGAVSNVGIATLRGLVGYNNVGFTVGGDANTYYPVIISQGGAFGMNRYSIHRNYNWAAPWDPIGTGVHKGGLTLTWDWSSDIAWGGNDKSWRIIQFHENYTTMVAGMALPVTDGIIVWLRGGGAYYELQGPNGINQTATVYLGTYTAANGATFAPRSNTSNVTSEILAKWPIRGYGDGDIYASNNIVLHAANYTNYAVALAGATMTGDLYVPRIRVKNTLYARHVEGKNWDDYSTSGELYLNYDSNSAVKIGSGAHIALHAGNYNNYSPTLVNGVGASGTWPISISGNAATASSAGYASSAGSAGTASSASSAGVATGAYYQYATTTSNNWNQSFYDTPVHSTSFREMSGNGPSGTWWFVQNFRHSNSADNWGTQLAWGWEDNANNLYQRNVSGSSWGGWVRYLNSSNYSSYALPLGGGTLTSRVYLHQAGAGGGQNLFTGLQGATTANGRAQFILSSAYSDLVIASSQANSVHGSTLTFASYNPSNAGDYRKFVLNQGNWGDRIGYLDFGYSSSNGRENPHDNINDTDVVMSLDGGNKRVGIGTRVPGHKLHVAGTIYTTTDVIAEGILRVTNGSADWDSIDLDAAGATHVINARGAETGLSFQFDGTQRLFLSNGGNLTASGDVTAYSDIRLKRDIQAIPEALKKVTSLRGVTFVRTDSNNLQARHAGVIAQEVEHVLPEVVGEDEHGNKHVAYGNMVGLLIEAIKEQQTEIAALRDEVRALKEG